MELLKNLIWSFFVPLVVAVGGAKITAGYERRKMVSELRRNTYMTLLRLTSKLLDNPTLIFNNDFMDEMKMSRIEMEVYATDKVRTAFETFWVDIEQRYKEYRLKFESEDAVEQWEEVRNFMPEGWADEMLEKEQFYTMIEMMPGYEKIQTATINLKQAIITELK